jgi:hypothetical protein
MARKNRNCFCCGKNYSFCPDCSRVDALKPSYFSDFCSEECMTIWTTATKYNMGKLTKSEAKEIISGLDLKPVDSYVKCVQRDLNAIMAEEKKQKRSHKKFEPVVVIAEEAIVEPVVIEEPVEVVQEHEVILTEDNKAL